MNCPNSYLVNPKEFGVSSNVKWRPLPRRHEAELEAAKIQNECATEIRKAIHTVFGSTSKYCKATQQDYQHVGRMLRGETQIKAEDLGKAVVHLGISITLKNRYLELSKSNQKATLAAHTPKRNDMGAFYTPLPVANYMVQHAMPCNTATILEPSFGDGSFISAALRYGFRPENITGVELDNAACTALKEEETATECTIHNMDFMDYPASNQFDLILGNPPYVRIRRLDNKSKNKALSISGLGGLPEYSEEASLWLPFTLKCVKHLKEGGNLALVLPYEVTYVRYARSIWSFLANSFERIEVARIHDRVFGNLMQDVVLLFCFSKGKNCLNLNYSCSESLDCLESGKPTINATVPIQQVAEGKRAFQYSMIPDMVLKTIFTSDHVSRVEQEAQFHIGYVCGNKKFFHPTKEDQQRWKLPHSSLHPTAASTRSIAHSPLWTKMAEPQDVIWLPQAELSKGEKAYVAYGEQNRFHESYKCKMRNPWWKVPTVRTPDLILSVFSNSPRIIINNASWTFSNSLLGGYLENNTNPEQFIRTWYTAITLLSIELEVHSLGGGVLVVVPREANRIHKLSSALAPQKPTKELRLISDRLSKNDTDGAYHVGDDLLANLFGPDYVTQVWSSINLLRSWRKRK